MKKIIIFILALVVFNGFYLVVTTDNREKFYLLNWGEYMDPDLIEQFENENNVSVVLEEVGSSEAMYQKISSNTTKYDIAIPGDYIIEKMYNDDMLYEIDLTQLSNYSENMFNDDLTYLLETSFFEGNQSYAVPYFWGAYSIIYSTNDDSIVSAVTENGFDVFFDRSLTNNAKIGMYDVPRWAVTAYLLSNNLDVNIVDLSPYESDIVSKISAADYDLWGNDSLKKQIADGNIDFAFVQLGDFFDQYYIRTESGDDVNFNAYIPDSTAAFYDGMVIPKTSQNYELALKFIDYFLDPEISKDNASYVGYCPTIKDTIELIREDEDFADVVENYPFYLDPLDGKTAVLFRDLGTEYSTVVETIITRAKNS